MAPEAKIWLILKNLNDALAVAPSGNLALLNAKDLEKLMAREDHEQILEKLVKDYKVMDIQKKPDYKKGFFYKFKITDSDEFNRILKNAHIKHFGSLEMLVGDNFFAVFDVAEDIMNELQMAVKNKITIPIIPSIIRFSTLLPAKAPNLIDRYWKFRWNALEYLANNKAIINAELHRNETYPLGSPVEVNLDRIKFTKFYEKLLKVYNKRVKFDDGKKNSRNMQDNLDYADTSSRKAWEKKWEVIKAVQVASDHRLIRDQWLNIKRILDAIYKQLSPLIKGQQIISLNPDTLPAEQKRLFSSVLKDMLKAGVADYFKVESKILADSTPIRRFLNGESIIIKDINNFEEYRKKIAELYNFIEQDGQKRFPKAYHLNEQALKVENMLDKLENDIKRRTSDRAISQPTKPIKGKQPKTVIKLALVSFDQKLCRLKYGNKKYTPQRKKGRCQILKELWKSREIVVSKNKVNREGSFKIIEELAIAGGFIKDTLEFNQNKKSADRSVRDAIQDLRDKFKEMKAPIKIVAQNGYMLVIKK